MLAQSAPYTRRGLQPASIVRVVERKRKNLAGVVSHHDPHRLLPSDARLDGYVITLSADSPGAEPGTLVSARIVDYPNSYRDITVCIEESLGKAGSLQAEIRAVCRCLDICDEFPAAALAEAAAFREPDEAEKAGRRDLRGQVTVTIDPADARDHDDAVSIERQGECYLLTVSIADVAHYVRPGSALDREAYERATSVYFPGEVVPMLPEQLSAGLASLQPSVERLALSVFIRIGKGGEILGSEFAPSVIRSVAALSYEQAQAMLDGQATGADPAIVEALECMRACAQALLKARMARGAIDLDIPEARILLDEQGQPRNIEKRGRLFTHRIIEEFMLAANEAVAQKLNRAREAFLYRIHEKPGDEALTSLAARAAALGLRLRHDGRLSGPASLQDLAAQARATPAARQVNLMLLRSMQQARYSADKDIHFGLASSCYTHFTSPIRRYPDLIAHRALLHTLGSGPPAAGTPALLTEHAEHCSTRERRAMEAERDAAAAAAAIYMAPRTEECFEATVSGVERFGFFVELDEVFVEGFVHVGRLPEYYSYVRERMELQSRVSGKCIRIGDRVRVRVSSVDLARRSIEMDLA